MLLLIRLFLLLLDNFQSLHGHDHTAAALKFDRRWGCCKEGDLVEQRIRTHRFHDEDPVRHLAVFNENGTRSGKILEVHEQLSGEERVSFLLEKAEQDIPGIQAKLVHGEVFEANVLSEKQRFGRSVNFLLFFKRERLNWKKGSSMNLMPPFMKISL